MRWIVVLCLSVVAGLALAAMPYGEKKIETDGGLAIVGTNVEMLADGEAQVTLYRKVLGGAGSAGPLVIPYPQSSSGDAYFTLVESVPRSFAVTAGIDSVGVVLVDATYVIVSWR